MGNGLRKINKREKPKRWAEHIGNLEPIGRQNGAHSVEWIEFANIDPTLRGGGVEAPGSV